ncbi:MAG: caspase family protein [Chitinophagaceae bacterium]|nr:caspase family protein [Chitinophagaceae bacterium]
MRLKRYTGLKISLTLCIFLSCSILTISQTPKGVILDTQDEIAQGKTRALIVGISKYEYIDTLQYADVDAKMFAQYLQQNSFWGIQKEDITLLTNDKARYGDLTVQLQRIAMISKPGDNLLFYFSGHGDVETQTIFNRGYLLAYDTYSSNYMANGLRVDDLKDLFVTLLSNNIKVIIVTDACRSGKLAGGLKGAEFTSAAISNMWKNEIKILSSQPGQLSYEDKKWGNGRGVFSYYLINGLNGDADTNKDSTITLSELEMYVGSNVARETGNKQQPIFEGPNKFSTIIGKLSSPSSNRNGKPAGNRASNHIKISFQQFDSCIFYYDQMTKAINENRLSSSNPNSATAIYQKLKQCAKGDEIQWRANGELLSSLMNASQEIINNSFVGKQLVSEDGCNTGMDLLQQFIDNNDLKLNTINHVMNLKKYLEVLGKTTWQSQINSNHLSLIIDSAIKEEPDASYLFIAKARLEMEKENWTEAIKLLNVILGKSPTWLIPKYYLGVCYAKNKNYKKALEYYEQVIEKDTTYKTFECTKCILLNMAEYALKTKQTGKALNYLYKNIELFPNHSKTYELLYNYAIEKKDSEVANKLISYIHKQDSLASMYLYRIRFEYDFFKTPFSPENLEQISTKLKNNFDSSEYYFTLSFYYRDTKTYDSDSVYYCLSTAVQLDSINLNYVLDFADFLGQQGDYDEAQQLLTSGLQLFSGDEKAQIQEKLANQFLYTGDFKKSFDLVIELIENGYYNCSDLKKMKAVYKNLFEFDKYLNSCKDK